MQTQTQIRRRSDRLLRKYGPWAVVTGASDGIGRAFAQRLAELGFNLVLVARREPRLQDLAAELSGRFARETRVVAADLGTPAGVAAVAEASAALDVGLLVAAAGFGASGRFIEGDVEVAIDMVRVNCEAVVASTSTFAKRFADQGRGGIVLMGSLLGFQGAPHAAVYGATKAFVQSFAEGLEVELAARNVDVVASAPGPVNSGFAERAKMTYSSAARPRTVARETLAALGRRGTVAPGALAKVLTGSLSLLPRPARVRLMGRIMGGMAGRP
jgi:short-subunit dehydrogenase